MNRPPSLDRLAQRVARLTRPQDAQVPVDGDVLLDLLAYITTLEMENNR